MHQKIIMAQQVTTAENLHSKPAVSQSLPTEGFTKHAETNFLAKPASEGLFDSTDKKTIAAPSFRSTAYQETLNVINGISVEYELDCSGMCWMPIVFRVYPTESTNPQLETSKPIFESSGALSNCCELDYPDTTINPTIHFAKTAFCASDVLKFKIGTYGEGCCANHDKIDVFVIDQKLEIKLGYIVKRISFCSYEWQIHGADDAIRYIISNTGCGLSTICHCPCSCLV